MQDRPVRAFGLALTIVYASFIVFLYVTQPQTLAQVTGSLSSSVGVYRIDQQAFDEGLVLFHQNRHDAARAAFARADPAERDARTQFYIAYSYYRSGWGRFYNDDEHFTRGLEHVDKAIALAPAGRLVVEDPGNGIHNADELRAELMAGLRIDETDLNPMRVFRRRK